MNHYLRIMKPWKGWQSKVFIHSDVDMIRNSKQKTTPFFTSLIRMECESSNKLCEKLLNNHKHSGRKEGIDQFVEQERLNIMQILTLNGKAEVSV